MNIQIYNKSLSDINKEIQRLHKSRSKIKNNPIESKSMDTIKNIVSNKEIKEMMLKLQDYKTLNNLSFNDLAKIEESSKILYENISRIKSEVELNDFLQNGYNIDIDSLERKYKEKKLSKKFPNLDFKKIKKLYVYPPKKIPTYYNPQLYMTIDSFVFRKYIIALLQMIFNHMDFVVCNVGDEGAGKSCKCSQDMYLLWWVMTEIGLITYKFEIKEIFANTLRKFSELEDKYYGVPFRIVGLDEGNELNRQDWKEDDVKLFWQRLRRERHEQRIKFINIPVLGEMLINIVLSRINFIFNMRNKNEIKTGTLYKGDYDFYIIPRGNKIYSPHLNKNITKEEIKNKLYINLKDKEYLKGLPRDILIKACHFNGVWGFKETEYIKELKETNKQYTVSKGLKFGLTELYCFHKANLTPAKMNIPQTNVIYPSLKKMVYKIKWFWNNDPDLFKKYEHIFKQKEKEKEKDNKNDKKK